MSFWISLWLHRREVKSLLNISKEEIITLLKYFVIETHSNKSNTKLLELCFELRGSFQKFCTLYVFSLKMSLFYKIHLQAFSVISIVLYHSGPTFGQVLYSCLDAFFVDVSDYSCHLIRHLLNAPEAFPTECFLQFWEQVKVWWAEPTRF
jgi:hypothetical protein